MSEKYCAFKLIALRLHDVNWLDRRWILQRLPADTRQPVLAELKSLRSLSIGNTNELYEQLKQKYLVGPSRSHSAFGRHLQQTLADNHTFSPATARWFKQSKLIAGGEQ